MIAVNGGILLSRCFLDILERRLFRLTSFLGFNGSCEASCSWIKKLAISEQHLKKRSFSGGRFASLGFFWCLSSIVMTSVAILPVLAPRALPPFQPEHLKNTQLKWSLVLRLCCEGHISWRGTWPTFKIISRIGAGTEFPARAPDVFTETLANRTFSWSWYNLQIIPIPSTVFFPNINCPRKDAGYFKMRQTSSASCFAPSSVFYSNICIRFYGWESSHYQGHQGHLSRLHWKARNVSILTGVLEMLWSLCWLQLTDSMLLRRSNMVRVKTRQSSNDSIW